MDLKTNIESNLNKKESYELNCKIHSDELVEICVTNNCSSRDYYCKKCNNDSLKDCIASKHEIVPVVFSKLVQHFKEPLMLDYRKLKNLSNEANSVDIKKLDNYVFINPRWVTDTIYDILDEETLENKGEFDKKRVVSALEKQRNDLTDSNLWIELMKEFELIFSKKDQPDQFVAPQYLPPNCKDLSEKAMNNLLEELPHRLVLYYPDFLPRSVISRFICRYGDLAKDEFWKYGIVLHKGGDKIVVSCEYEHKNITIRSARRCSDLALEALGTLRKIDHFPALELGVSDTEHPDQLIGPVRLEKLEQEISKGREEIESHGHWIPLASFKEVFRRGEMGMEHPGGKMHSRSDFGFEKEESTFPVGEIIEVPMMAGARFFVPFSELQDIRLLYMAATPMNQGQLNTGKESRFKDLIRYFDDEKRFAFTEQHGITKEQFRHFLLSSRPHIVHYGGHGNKVGIILEDGEMQGAVLASAMKLSLDFRAMTSFAWAMAATLSRGRALKILQSGSCKRTNTLSPWVF